MPDKPSYLGLLNGVSLAESRAHKYLSAWAAVTPSAEVKAVLTTVAAREGEHGMAFAKRIDELGFELQERDDPNFAHQMAVASSDMSDLEKMEELRLLEFCTDGPDVFDKFFADHSIDIRTGELLGRYIAEERDTLRRLKCCYDLLQEAAASGPASVSSTAPSADLHRLEAKVDALCQTVEQICQLVSAPAVPSAAVAANGKASAKRVAK